MNAIFRVERVTLVDRLVGFFMMLRWRVRKHRTNKQYPYGVIRVK